MAIYQCEHCDKLIDGDHFPCVEHPTEENAFCCESCAEELEEEADMEKEFKRMKAEYDREVISGLQRQLKR